MVGILRPLWAYRGFILGSVRREFQLKYRNSLLGAAWTVIQPLMMIVVYTVIIFQSMKARLPGRLHIRLQHTSALVSSLWGCCRAQCRPQLRNYLRPAFSFSIVHHSCPKQVMTLGHPPV
jgi:hypothetical protein